MMAAKTDDLCDKPHDDNHRHGPLCLLVIWTKEHNKLLPQPISQAVPA